MSNREIKFRVYLKGVMSKPFSLQYTLMNFTDENGLGLMKSYGGEPVMQYTGLKDKNGKEIYEGDVVKCDGEVTAVTYEDYGFAPFVYQIPNACDAYSEWEYKSIEVIGNIYENHELLGE